MKNTTEEKREAIPNSVSRMLLEFVKEGLLLQKDHSYQLSEAGLAAYFCRFYGSSGLPSS